MVIAIKNGGEYPKKFGIVGYNDETKESAYLGSTTPIWISFQNPIKIKNKQ